MIDCIIKNFKSIFILMEIVIRDQSQGSSVIASPINAKSARFHGRHRSVPILTVQNIKPEFKIDLIDNLNNAKN